MPIITFSISTNKSTCMLTRKTKRRIILPAILSLAIIVLLSIYFLPATQTTDVKAEVAHLKKTYNEHNESIWKVQFSPEGKYIASCSIDSTVIIREKETGQETLVLKHPSGVTNLDYSQDGKHIVTTAYDEKVRLWQLADGKLIREFSGHKGTVWAVSISPNAQLIASGGEDKCLRLWDLKTGALLKTIIAHNRNIWSVKFNPDGNLLATGSFDNDVKLWDVATGTLKHTLTGHTEAVVEVAFSNDGKLLASAADDAKTRIWNVQDGKLLQTLSGGNEHLHTVAFSPDNKTLVVGGSDKPMFGELLQHLFGDSHKNKGVSMRLWEIGTGRILQTFSQHANDVNGVDFSDDGQWIASGSSDKTVCLWQVYK
jgi:WD40 repeat protein